MMVGYDDTTFEVEGLKRRVTSIMYRGRRQIIYTALNVNLDDVLYIGIIVIRRLPLHATVFFSLNPLISPSSKPSSSFSTSSVCCPSSGGGVRILGSILEYFTG